MDTKIGARIKERRKALKLTGKQVKERTGISTGNLSDIENGKSLPSAVALIQLSQILDCSIDYILLGETRASEAFEHSDARAAKKQFLEQFYSLSEEDQEEIQLIVQLKYDRQQRARERKQ